jgi:3-hydroxymyristoyl/3-hydroxydecanoyl-(acyl carrier protein) dehydratase
MVKEVWHLPENIESLPSGETKATIAFTSESPWFSGHFPGAPILPGIAMLSMVKETIVAGNKERAGEITITGVKRVRFRQPVYPSDRISVLVSGTTGELDKSYSFRIIVDENVACSGIVTVK